MEVIVLKSILKINDIVLDKNEAIVLNGKELTINQLGSAVHAYNKQLARNKLRNQKRKLEKEKK